MAITEPGIYPMSNAEYHADPALGSTGARALLPPKGCPALFRHRQDHPETKEEFDIGSALHLLALEPDLFHGAVGVVNYDTYDTKAAKAARDDIRATGRIPLTLRQLTLVEGMRAALAADPIAGVLFGTDRAPIRTEQALFWRDEEYGFMCKTKPDAMPASPDPGFLVDLKSAASADPEDFQKAIWNFGYACQGAWYLDGVEKVLGVRPKRFVFVVVSKVPPHLVITVELTPQAIEWGDILNRRARSIFAWCLKHDRWPGYQPDLTGNPKAFVMGLPWWAERDLQRSLEAGELEPVAL